MRTNVLPELAAESVEAAERLVQLSAKKSLDPAKGEYLLVSGLEALNRITPLWPIIRSRIAAGTTGTTAQQLLARVLEAVDRNLALASVLKEPGCVVRAGQGQVSKTAAELARVEEQLLAIGAEASHLLKVVEAPGRWPGAEQLKAAKEQMQHGNRLTAEEFRQTLVDDLRPWREIAISLKSLGNLYANLGRVDEALTLIRKAAAIDDQMIVPVFVTGSDLQRLLFLGKLRPNTNRFLSLVYYYLPPSPEAAGLAFDLLLRRKGLASETLAAQRDAVLGGRYPHLQEVFGQLTQIRRRLAQKTLAGPDPDETLAAHQQTLHQWEIEQQQRETKLAHQIPEINLEQQLFNADRRAVALALPEGVALIEFVRFDVYDFHAVPARGEGRWKPARYLALVLPGDQAGQVKMFDLGEAEPIDQMIADFRESVAVPPRDRPDRDIRRSRKERRPPTQGQPGSELRAAVFEKLVSALGGCKGLLLAPDGDLTRLPFEVLPDAKGRILLEEFPISYLSCGRDVLRFGAKSSGQPTEPLVVADPLFDLLGDTDASVPAEGPGSRCSRDFKKSDYHFPRLPGTREEGERVAALLGVQPWLEGAALETRLKERRSPRVLHLATHGFFLTDQERDPNKESRALEMLGGKAGSFGRLSGPLPENPLLRSGLALAGAQTWLDGKPLPPEAEDGLLTAEDVAGLDLLNTELVVLSACETGLGEVHTGEGVFGLRRAFIVAGARTLVMSLWKVPDEQTRELMIDFHTRVLSGQGVADALRQAQLAMREKYPDPYFWGAFICHGNPGPLSGV